MSNTRSPWSNDHSIVSETRIPQMQCSICGKPTTPYLCHHVLFASMEMETHNHIKKIVDFFINDEKKHFLENDNKPEDHIYISLKKVDEWLSSTLKK